MLHTHLYGRAKLNVFKPNACVSMYSSVAKASLSGLYGVYRDWWGVCLEQAVQKRPGRLPTFFLSHLQTLYFLTLCSPTVFLASRHFYINLFTGPLSSFAPSLQSQLSSFFICPHRSLGVLSHHYCLCLPSFSLLGISVFAQFSYPTHFMNLIPFLTVSRFGGRYWFASCLFLIICSLAHSSVFSS